MVSRAYRRLGMGPPRLASFQKLTGTIQAYRRKQVTLNAGGYAIPSYNVTKGYKQENLESITQHPAVSPGYNRCQLKIILVARPEEEYAL
ncbi:hypothetical protein BaRGS_00007577 [Batillaria attramentaria]|uniref:Uncharacterized protein n=1 Tax=Batillaria attramentaria TaxID=370345 RepID=A0ABD0LNB2_9CAEN